MQRTTKKTSCESRNVIPDESLAFNEKDTISSFEELATQARFSEIPFLDSTSLFIFQNKQKIIFQSQAFLEDTGIPLYVFWMKDDMTFEAFHLGVKCSITTLSLNKIITISRRSQIEEVI